MEFSSTGYEKLEVDDPFKFKPKAFLFKRIFSWHIIKF